MPKTVENFASKNFYLFFMEQEMRKSDPTNFNYDTDGHVLIFILDYMQFLLKKKKTF